MKIATTKERILQFIEFKGITKSSFLKETGLKRGVLDADKITSSISDIFITRIIATYPEINLSWLMMGEGEMLNIDKHLNCKSSDLNSCGSIPLYNAEASAGVGQLQLSNEYIIDQLQVPFARKDDIALTIVGDSMTPAMQSGDIAVVRNMPNWKEYLDYGNIFVVVTENEVYCKIIQKNNEKDIFTLKSYNSNYNEFEIPKKFISQIYKVIGIISQRSY